MMSYGFPREPERRAARSAHAVREIQHLLIGDWHFRFWPDQAGRERRFTEVAKLWNMAASIGLERPWIVPRDLPACERG